MPNSPDIKLLCRECNKQFLFTEGEQEFYNRKGFTYPSRCPECRAEKRTLSQHLVCSQCRTELEKGASIFCTACLASVQLEFELKDKEYQNAVDEAQSKLQVTQSQKAELTESLGQQEQLINELEQQVSVLGHDLDKARQFHYNFEQLQPTLKRIEERLEAVEQAQLKSNQRMLQLVQKMHEMRDNTSLFEKIKRSLRHYQRQGA